MAFLRAGFVTDGAGIDMAFESLTLTYAVQTRRRYLDPHHTEKPNIQNLNHLMDNTNSKFPRRLNTTNHALLFSGSPLSIASQGSEAKQVRTRILQFIFVVVDFRPMCHTTLKMKLGLEWPSIRLCSITGNCLKEPKEKYVASTFTSADPSH